MRIGNFGIVDRRLRRRPEQGKRSGAAVEELETLLDGLDRDEAERRAELSAHSGTATGGDASHPDAARR